jgi:7,8-dihydropterin-6-yl-methyl-4-(beta-D-ribofuranosyl)aminobenzene 5'-phosphate synthase
MKRAPLAFGCIPGVVLASCVVSPTDSPTATNRSPAIAVADDLGDDVSHVPATDQAMVDDYKITILSDMIVGRRTAAEWGFAALVQVTSGGVTKQFLFDTGGPAATVVTNAGLLGIDLCGINDIVLSHNHADHTRGLNALRNGCSARNPQAFTNVYVGGDQIFWPRIRASDGGNDNVMTAERGVYEGLGGSFIVNPAPTPEFLGLPGVWLTGQILRNHDEKTYPGTPNIQDPSGALSPDLIPEETALMINTRSGLVIVTGCAHAGITNTIETAQVILGGETPPLTLVGGMHFFPLALGDHHTEGTVAWEAKQLQQNGVASLLGSHCTGLERFVYVRDRLGLDQSVASFSTIGTVLSMNGGLAYTNPAINTPLQ